MWQEMYVTGDINATECRQNCSFRAETPEDTDTVYLYLLWLF